MKFKDFLVLHYLYLFPQILFKLNCEYVYMKYVLHMEVL